MYQEIKTFNWKNHLILKLKLLISKQFSFLKYNWIIILQDQSQPFWWEKAFADPTMTSWRNMKKLCPFLIKYICMNVYTPWYYVIWIPVSIFMDVTSVSIINSPITVGGRIRLLFLWSRTFGVDWNKVIIQ